MTASVPSTLDRALTETDDASADINTSYVMTVDDVFTGTLDREGDHDWIAFEVTEAGRYAFFMRGSPSGSGTLDDPYIYLRDSAGVEIALNDDGGIGYDARLRVTLTDSGTYFLDLGAFADQHQGSYELSIYFAAPIEGTDAADTLVGEDRGDRILGYEGDDLLQGLGGRDRLHGNEGNDTLIGGTGRDRIFGGFGQDEVNGGRGNDLLLGHFDDDILRGGKEHDQIRGGAGEDTLYGNAGYDRLHGGEGNDLLSGGRNSDVLFGGEGDDHLIGGAGRDTLFGESGNDLFEGGSGRDFLHADRGGNDTLTGGAGGDDFIFSTYGSVEGSTEMVITDFDGSQSGEQIIVYGSTLYEGYDDFLANYVSQLGDDVVIELDVDMTLTLLGVSVDDLTQENFIFWM